MPESKRQLAAIMFTDIVGYTALMGDNEDRAFQILKQFKDIATPLVKKKDGKWHKDLGDGALCSFGSALDAVKAGIIIQDQINSKTNFRVRIGIHLGDVTFQNGDVFGDGVNVASRLQSEAAPGGICLSETVFKNIRNKDGIKTQFLGTRKLKNVEGPLRLYQVSLPNVETKKRTKVRLISIWEAIALSIAMALLSGFLVWYFSNPEKLQQSNVERYEIHLPQDAPLALIGSAHFDIGQTALAISPNDELLVYACQEAQTTRLYIRRMDSYEVEVLKGTEGAFSPFFSPDGKWIAFFSDNYLKKVSINGGEPLTLCQASNPIGGVWTPDDRIIYSDNEGGNLMWIDSSGNKRHDFHVEGDFRWIYF